jgi:Fe-S oxidoreductase
LAPWLQSIQERCTGCGNCQKACAFLSHYGKPKRIAVEFDFSLSTDQAIAYECSLCGLCAAVCPEQLDPARLFLEIRRLCVDDGHFVASPYRTILGYEKIGVSPLFSWYGLPEGCDTVFFPGCALPGTRPAVTTKMYRQLLEAIPGLGLVLDCCAKPSHDLGRADRFHTLFSEMNEYLVDHGVHTVLTACPSCTKIFRQYGHGLTVRTVYETLHDNGCCIASEVAGMAASVHDPCALRGDFSTQQAVRGLLTGMGHTLVEMKHRQQLTLCCGEGGTVGAINPDLAGAWTARHGRQVIGQKMITYCAGCTAYLNRTFPTLHIADLLYRPDAALKGKLKIARAPITYWNRFRLKQRMKKEIQAKVQRQRPAVSSNPCRFGNL